MYKICVKAVGLLDEVVCVEIEECVSVGDLIMKIFSTKEIKVSLEAVIVSDGLRTLELSENACFFKELVIYRVLRGG
ncbi:MAG: hypothetical protein QN229_06495 [Desulfurococcaceae archaeon TW002]